MVSRAPEWLHWPPMAWTFWRRHLLPLSAMCFGLKFFFFEVFEPSSVVSMSIDGDNDLGFWAGHRLLFLSTALHSPFQRNSLIAWKVYLNPMVYLTPTR